jgi:hypothetical protein
MIARIWHGWTLAQNADAYEQLLRHEIFRNIANKMIPGFASIELLRRPVSNETEFVTIMHFTDINAVKSFAGEDYEKSVVPENAKQLLIRYDERSQHYEIREERKA